MNQEKFAKLINVALQLVVLALAVVGKKVIADSMTIRIFYGLIPVPLRVRILLV
jgi:hypothetical protein